MGIDLYNSPWSQRQENFAMVGQLHVSYYIPSCLLSPASPPLPPVLRMEPRVSDPLDTLPLSPFTAALSGLSLCKSLSPGTLGHCVPHLHVDMCAGFCCFSGGCSDWEDGVFVWVKEAVKGSGKGGGGGDKGDADSSYHVTYSVA